MTVKSRANKQVTKKRRIAFFRNEMNKAWIGAKKHKNPTNQMKIVAKHMFAHYNNEKETVKEGVAQWYVKHPECKAWEL